MSSNNILSQSKKTTLVKLTSDNVQNLYPELSRYIDYNLDMSINTIDEEYTKLLGKDFKNSNGTPNLKAIYSQVLTDIGRLVIYINSELLSIEEFDKYMMRYMQSNNTNNDPPSSVDDLKKKLSKLFPKISVLNNDEILSAMFDVSKETTGNKWALIPYIYYIYNSRCGITDDNLIIILMVLLQQGVASSSFNVAKETYQQLAFDIDVGGGSSIDKWFAGYRETRLHIYQNIRSTQSIKVNKPAFAFYTDNKYNLFAVDTEKYIDFNANKVFNLMKQPEWRNDAIKTTYELIQNLGSEPVDIETGKLMAKVIFKDYKNASIQPLLANIFARFLTDRQKGAETYETLQKFITDMLNEKKEDMIVKNLSDFDNALKTNPDDFVASMTQSIEKYNSCKDQLDLSCKESEQPLPIDINSYSRLKQFQMWLKQVVKSVYDNTISMSAEDDDISIELGKSAIVWVNKAAEWADKDSIAEVQGAVEQIQGISSKLDALAKLYNDKNIQQDDPVAVDFNNMKNTINHNAKLVNAALNVALSIVIIRAIRQSNGIGSRVDVVDSVLKAALESVRQADTQVQTGGADGDNKDDTLKQAETKAKDLYDIAMALLNINAEVMEEAAKSNPVIVNDRSILANTLTILMNTKIPGKRILKYDPKMTIPGVNSSYVCFDPRVKLKQSIVNNVQPNASMQYGGMFPFTQTATTSAAQSDEICMQFFRRNEFNSLLLRTMNESPQEIYGLKDAKDMGITDNNIQVTLDTLFKHGNVMYIQGAPYTINLYDWVYGDWQIDTRPNLNIPQIQAPIITSYGVIVPNRSNIAMFEKEAKRERDTIPADAQKGDALESGSKIRKAIRSVLSPVTQNVKVNVTPNDIVKPISTWALMELLEQQKRNQQEGYPIPVTINEAPKENVEASQEPVKNTEVIPEEKTEENEISPAVNEISPISPPMDNIINANNLKVPDKPIRPTRKNEQTNEKIVQVDSFPSNIPEERPVSAPETKLPHILSPPRDDIIPTESIIGDKDEETKDPIPSTIETKIATEPANIKKDITEKLPKDLMIHILNKYVKENKPPEEPLTEQKMLARQLLNALMESAIKGIFNSTSTKRLFVIDKKTGKIKNIQNNVINHINKWTIGIPSQNATSPTESLLQAISDIFKMDDIPIELRDNDNKDAIIKYFEQEQKTKLILIKVPSSKQEKPDKFELNQRVKYTDIARDAQNVPLIRKVNGKEATITNDMYGVVVKVNTLNNTYTILLDDYEIRDNIPYNKLSLTKNRYTIYTPELEPELIPDNIAKLKQCAFILYNEEDPSGNIFKPIYQTSGTGRIKTKKYNFDLTSLPSYFLFMIFLVSYQFNTPSASELIGEFTKNNSIYNKIDALNTNQMLIGIYNIYTYNLKHNPYDTTPETSIPIENEPKRLGVLLGGSAGGGGDLLIEAIKSNNLALVEDELKRDPSLVNAKDEYGNTPLYYACEDGRDDIALLLLKYNADATIKNNDGKTPLNVCNTNQLCIDLITNIVKRDLSKIIANTTNAGVVVNDNDDSIKKSLSYYLKDPQKTEAKNSYYVVVDLDLHPGTSISVAQKLRMQCARVFDNIQEARADIKGVDYVPQEMTIPEAVPIPPAIIPIPSAKTRTRKNANRIKGGRTKRHKNKGRKSKQTRKYTRVKRRRNSRRRAKK